MKKQRIAIIIIKTMNNSETILITTLSIEILSLIRHITSITASDANILIRGDL